MSGPHIDDHALSPEERRAALRHALRRWVAGQDRAPGSTAEVREHAPPWFDVAGRAACPRQLQGPCGVRTREAPHAVGDEAQVAHHSRELGLGELLRGVVDGREQR